MLYVPGSNSAFNVNVLSPEAKVYVCEYTVWLELLVIVIVLLWLACVQYTSTETSVSACETVKASPLFWLCVYVVAEELSAIPTL